MGMLNDYARLTVGSFGDARNVIPPQKKLPVSFSGGFFNVPEGFLCRGISYKTDTGGKAISIKLLHDDTTDVIELEKNLMYPMEIKQIVESGTTAADIIIWG